MGAVAAVATPVNLLRPAAGLGYAPSSAGRAKIKSVAQEFEASFIGQMLQPMFEGLSTAAPFGGGEGEGAFRSFLVDAMAKGMAKNGGIGLAPAIEREMIKMQAMNSANASTAAAAATAQSIAAKTPATSVQSLAAKAPATAEDKD
ncbi:MAG TPA: rod-binding protein [Caulobacteraceae bacterium]|jgi:Rod binding domain-containing protein|nr:rod-binding protein [Caulobacteraceae bacterium]